MKPIKIVILINKLSIGGAQIQAYLLAKHLNVDNNFKVFFWSLEDGAGLKDLLDREKINWSNLEFSYHRFFKSRTSKALELYKLIKKIRKVSPDIVLPYTHYPNILTNSIHFFLRTKFCFWNDRGKTPNVPVTNFELFAVKRCSMFVANYPQGANHLFERLKINAEPRVILNGYAYSLDKTATGKILCKDSINLVMLANFYPLKDHFTAVQAIKILIEDYALDDLKLYLFGYSPDIIRLNGIKALIYDLGLSEYIIIDTPVENVEHVLKQCEIGLLITDGEGTSNTLLDYMANKLPIVATNIQENKDVLSEKNHRFLSQPGNPKDLAIKIKEMLKIGNEEKEHLLEDNYLLIKEKFTVKSMVENYKDLFLNLFKK